MMDKSIPQGFVQDAEEALGRARAMRDQAHANWREWEQRALRLHLYLGSIRAWADAGGKGPRPRKPKFDIE